MLSRALTIISSIPPSMSAAISIDSFNAIDKDDGSSLPSASS